MTKKLFIGLFLVCFVLVPIAYLKADSGRESKQLPPQEVEIMYSSEDHAYQAKDISDVVRWKILPDGTMAIYNTSGATVYAINGAAGKPIGGTPKINCLFVDTEAEAEAKSTDYNMYLVDTVGYAGYTDTDITGVSFYMPTGSAALDGFRIVIMNISESGTTDILFVAADDVVAASGVTDGIWTDQTVIAGGVTRVGNGATKSGYVYDVNDVKGEMLEFTYVWATGGGTWYQTDRK